MSYDDDPLDLLEDDGDGVIEMGLLEDEEDHRKSEDNNNSGCCVVFLLVSSPALLTIWGITKLFA